MSKTVQSMEAWDYFTSEQRNDERHIGHYFEWFEDVFPQIEQKKKEIVHNSQCDTRDRKVIVCPRCGDERVTEHSYYHNDYCESCSELNRQEEYRRKNNERLTEQFPNEFGIKKVWHKDIWHYPSVSGEELKDENGDYIRGEIHEQMYETPCGAQQQVNHTTVREFAESHKCTACRVLLGKSKAVVMTQSDVASLFCKGIDGKHTGNKGDNYFAHYNYHSRDGILMHYGTVEGVRLKNGKVIDNTQCWSSGFAKCSLGRGNYSLPLSTIEDITRSESQLREIEILDDNDDETLFKVDGRVILYGRDEYRPFLVQIPNNPTTIKEAYENLKPALVKELADRDIKRQGDLYFIPLNTDNVDNIEKTQFLQSCDTFYRNLPDEWEFRDDEKLSVECKKMYSELKALNEKKLPKEENLKEATRIAVEFHKQLPIKKELYRPQIFKTNHVAQEMGKFSEFTVVRGKVRHKNRQHSVLDLGNKWHIVLQNLGIQSWQVPNRGTGGGGD